MTTAEILDQAANLVLQGWTQGTYARDGAGFEVPFDYPGARKFCGEGAVLACGSAMSSGTISARKISPETGMAGCLVYREAKDRGYESFAAFNDAAGRTCEEVSEFLRAAKARA